jgi:hypothetical protein
MPTSQQYRQQADECLELIDKASEWYVRMALLQLAEEFKKRAEHLERRRKGKAASVKERAGNTRIGPSPDRLRSLHA